MTYSDEAGLMGVRAKYGAAVEQRMRNWPKLARAFALAWYGDVESVRLEVDEAEQALRRAAKDPAWALEQAAHIARAGLGGELIPDASLIVKRQAEVDAKPPPPKREPSLAADTFGAWLIGQQDEWGGKHPNWQDCRFCKEAA